MYVCMCVCICVYLFNPQISQQKIKWTTFSGLGAQATVAHRGTQERVEERVRGLGVRLKGLQSEV